MPRPPLLPVIDWKAVFESGVDYDAWIAKNESPDNCKKMGEILSSISLRAEYLAMLQALPRPIHVIAIAEDWCGDVVRHAPYLRALENAAPQLQVRFISREQHLDVFARFLTNGGEAIPKFVFLSDQFVECGNWGPMPDACRILISRGKASGNIGAARKIVSALYEADSIGLIVINELIKLIDIASSPELI